MDAPPPHARPGECYARVTLPPRVEHYREKVLVEEARELKRVIPARYAPQTREVVVKEATRRTVVHEPVYETVAETVVVRPGYEKKLVEPAQVRTVHERVTVAPPGMVWKQVSSPLHPTPVWCLVPIPAKTAVRARTVVVKPETVRTVAVPPELRTVPRDVLRSPGRVEEYVEPAVVERVTTQELVEPERVELTRTPAVYKEVSRTRVVEPGRREWVRVLCEAEADHPRIKRLQHRLHQRGYYKGSVDGLYGEGTAEAVRRFQHDKGLHHEGYLSAPTLEALGEPMPAPVTAPPTPTPLGPKAPLPPKAPRN
jgi:regulator of extracellular matrix RemA (YlzA/DUF370 family)